jgi:hypothetical protein
MSLVEDLAAEGVVEELPVVWCAADADRALDPVTDVVFGRAGPPDAMWIAAVVEHCAQGLAVLASVDPSQFDAATVEAWAVGVEQLRRQATAAGIVVADHVDVAQPFRRHGFFTAKAWLKHRLQLSGPEAYGRVQEARLRRAVGVWNNALAAGQVGVAQTRLMARIAANPRIPADVLTTAAWQLMIDAMDHPYDEFERRAHTFEMLADPIGAATKSERAHQRRTVTIGQGPDGGWSLHASLDDSAGPGHSSAASSPTPPASSSTSVEHHACSPASPARPSCSSNPSASGPAATTPTPGATPTTSQAGPPAARPHHPTAPLCAPATTTSKNRASSSPATSTATGPSPHPTAPPSSDRARHRGGRAAR